VAVFDVTIDSTRVPVGQTDFPVLVKLSDMPAAFWTMVRDGGGDIRAYESDGTTELPREVISCDAVAQTGELRVLISNLSAAADTVIKINVDGTRSNYAYTSPHGRDAVWTNHGFAFHGTNLEDSSGSVGALTNVGATARAEGIIGEDYLYEDSYIASDSVPLSINSTDTFTMSIWFEPQDPLDLPFASYIFGIADNSDAFDNFAFGVSRWGSELRFFMFDRNTSAEVDTVLTITNYSGKSLISVEVTATGSTMSVFNNGTEYTGTSTRHLIDSGFDVISVGALRDSSPEASDRSYLDEARIRIGGFISGREETQYNNDSSPSTFYTITEAVSAGVTIEPFSADQSQALNNVTLTQSHGLVVHGAGQSVSLDNTSLLQSSLLSAQGLDQFQTLDNAEVSAAGNVSADTATQSQSIDNASMTQTHSLAASDASQAQSVDNAALSEAVHIVAQALVQSVAIDSAALTQAHSLIVQSLDQFQTLAMINLGQSASVVVQSLAQIVALDAITLIQASMLTVNDVTQAQALDATALFQNGAVVVHSLRVEQIIDSVIYGVPVIAEIRGQLSIISAHNGFLTIRPIMLDNLEI